jgi:hypothetical protein
VTGGFRFGITIARPKWRAVCGAAPRPTARAVAQVQVPVVARIRGCSRPDPLCGESSMSTVGKVVLAYSGGLDTSVIVRWLQETYGCEVVTFTADIGQGEELEPAREKAELLGVKEIYIEDLREEFVRDFVFPMFRANAIYEGEYLLGTSIARPLIAKRLVEIAEDRRGHHFPRRHRQGQRPGAFRTGAYALMPGIKVIAPWREWDLTSRSSLIAYCEQHSIPIEMKRGQEVAVLDGREPAAYLLRRRRTGRPVVGAGATRCGADGFAGEGAEHARIHRDRIRKGRRWSRRTASSSDALPIVLATLNQIGAGAWRRPSRPGGKPLRRHEEPRRYETPGGTVC